jgi:hypothetical protein
VCRLWTEEESESNLAIQRIGYPRHAGCVRTWRAAGTDPLIADVRLFSDRWPGSR